MLSRFYRVLSCLLLAILTLSSVVRSQSFNSSVSGMVTDPTGAVIPDAQLTLRFVGTGREVKLTTGSDGFYRFANLSRGAYDLTVSKEGFKEYVRRGIDLELNQNVTVDVKLELGGAVERIEVTAEASPLNREDATLRQAITPGVLAQLPLLVQGNSRSAANFITLMPGVTTGGGNNPFNARVNGGMEMGDEAVLDGVTMQEGLMSQSGMVALGNDYPMTPEAVAEVSLLTSNYEPQYGSTTSGVITMVTKSGTSEFHGELHEFLRNTRLNARQFGVPDRPKDIENEFGGSLGGRLQVPGFWGGQRRTYFFFNWDRWTIRGGTRSPLLTIPTEKMRTGDFSEWPFAVYDPDTNPRQQFMGCDPVNDPQPNVICPTDPRLSNSLARGWLKHLPPTDFNRPLFNYISPVPESDISGLGTDHRTSIDLKLDFYLGEKDHIAAVGHYHNTVFARVTTLPEIISPDTWLLPDGGQIGPWNARLNWDHSFSPTLLNNFNYGVLIMKGSERCIDEAFADQVPKIPGVPSHQFPPTLNFEDHHGMGCNFVHYESRPTNVVNNMMTWIKGKHTVRFGGELRWLTNNFHQLFDTAGNFSFSHLNTGSPADPDGGGHSIASFLLERVAGASVGMFTVGSLHMRAKQWNLHAGDTWKVTPNLSVTYGVRWDVAQPAQEKWDHLSLLDPDGLNPGAGNRPGRVAFAGTRSRLLGIPYEDAAFGRRTPELTWYKGVAPRLGIAYSVNNKTVVRTGYGIFYNQAFYPGWGGGASLDGFNFFPGVEGPDPFSAAFILSQGFPRVTEQPPFINSTFLNGQDGPQYRPFEANRLAYSQQWNLTIEREFTPTFYISAGYIGNKGTRLPSITAPLNALDPRFLSMGPGLFNSFFDDDGNVLPEVNGVQQPYAGWAEQMGACAPTVAQALLPYPQYCGSLQGLNENAGNSIYHSFQFKAEKRYAQGTWLLAAYTVSKLLTSADSAQSIANEWSGASGVISPFERHRNKALSIEDVPQTLSLAFIYDLPFGSGKRWLNRRGAVDKILGGWGFNTIFRVQSGIPFFFRNFSSCAIPGQFRAGCIPAILPGANVLAQNPSDFDPDKGPLFNIDAFEKTGGLPGPDGIAGTGDDVFYFGSGARVSNVRGPGFQNQDLTIYKRTSLTDRAGLEFRAEFFNVWNWHIFNCPTRCFGFGAFDNDVGSPFFGEWNGTVSPPRTIQFGLKLIF